MLNSKSVKAIAISTSLLLTVLLTGCNQKPAISQQEKEAVIALKKLEAKVQTGINQSDYVAALGETVFAVNMLGDEKDSKNQELDDAIRSAMADYKLAGDVWKLRIETTLNPRDASGAIRLSDPEAQNILNKIPSINKPITGDLLAQKKKNTYVQALIALRVADSSDQVKPLLPQPGDGAVFTQDGYPKRLQSGEVVVGVKMEKIQYLDLEIVTRLLWFKAGESLDKAYKMTAS